MPGAIPAPLITTISPGATGPVAEGVGKLAAFANITLFGPGGFAVRVKVALRPAVVALIWMVPAIAPAVTVVEDCPFAPVVADGVPNVAVPLMTWNVMVAPGTGFPLASATDTTT